MMPASFRPWLPRLLFIAGAGLLSGCTPDATTPAPGRAMNPEGWEGRRFYEGRHLLSEEYDTEGDDGRIDLWRFYDKGRLLLEERDRDADGRIDYTAHYDLDTGDLIAMERDSDFDGVTDLRIRYERGFRWEQTRDRNGDGAVDMRVGFKGPSRLLSETNADWLAMKDLRDVLPPAALYRYAGDEDTDGRWDRWVVYDEGVPVKKGVDADQDGTPERWLRLAPPPAPQAPDTPLARDADAAPPRRHPKPAPPLDTPRPAPETHRPPTQPPEPTPPPATDNEPRPPAPDASPATPATYAPDAPRPRNGGLLPRLRHVFGHRPAAKSSPPPDPEADASPSADTSERLTADTPHARATARVVPRETPTETTPEDETEQDAPPPKRPRTWRHPSDQLPE